MYDISTTRRFENGTLIITIPANVLAQIKTAQLIGKTPKDIEATCIISFVPDDYVPPDIGELF